MKLLVSSSRAHYAFNETNSAPEDNEISFPEGAKITNLVSIPSSVTGRFVTKSAQEFPDDDWWMGEYEGKSGLFPANYVQLDE